VDAAADWKDRSPSEFSVAPSGQKTKQSEVAGEYVRRKRTATNNLKVGGTGLAKKWERAQFFGPAPSNLLAPKAQLVVLVSAFVMVSTVWSVSCLLFFYSRCPAICKSGGTCPRALWSRRHGLGPNTRNARITPGIKC